MSNLEFVRKLYKNKYCYSDHMTPLELELLHIPSNVESIITNMLQQGRIVFLTGNPGDGKTFIIKAIMDKIDKLNAYIQTDLNQLSDYTKVAKAVYECYKYGRPAVLAVNEYPFLQLCKCIREVAPDLYKEIVQIRKASIVYDIPKSGIKKIVIVDLNERTLLDRDRHRAEEILDRICELLSKDENIGKVLTYNLNAVKDPNIRKQLLGLFDLASVSCEHFSARDILGAFSFILTACETDEFGGMPYYEAVFVGDNPLLKAIQEFDPIYLSKPSLDEAIWNGETLEGWYMGFPDDWPHLSKYDDVDDAIDLFQSIKRRYYFENVGGKELVELQPSEVSRCTALFVNFEREKRSSIEKIVKAINKLFLPSSSNKKQLRIWTTHRYNMSLDPFAAVSSRYVSVYNLDLQMPRPADWLIGIEYMPNHLLLKPKGQDDPSLKLDIDFLRTLDAINEGYPVGLLAPQYEQAASMFLHKLLEAGLTEENDCGQVIIASRKKSYQKSIYIQDGKYSFDGEDE